MLNLFKLMIIAAHANTSKPNYRFFCPLSHCFETVGEEAGYEHPCLFDYILDVLSWCRFDIFALVELFNFVQPWDNACRVEIINELQSRTGRLPYSYRCIYKLSPSAIHSIQGIYDLLSTPARDTFQISNILFYSIKHPQSVAMASKLFSICYLTMILILLFAFSPDGKLVATGSNGGTISLWDVATGNLSSKLQGHFGDRYAVTFSPDGKLVAIGCSDGTVWLWDAAPGKPLPKPNNLLSQTVW